MTDPAQPIPPVAPPADGAVAREPVAVFLAGLAGVVDIGLIMATALDWVTLTNEQCAAVVAFVSAVCALIGAVLRSLVYAPATVRRLRAT